MKGVVLAVIDGNKKHEVVSINSDDVVLKGFQVQNSGFATLNDPGGIKVYDCLLYTSPSPRDRTRSRMPSSA